MPTTYPAETTYLTETDILVGGATPIVIGSPDTSMSVGISTPQLEKDSPIQCFLGLENNWGGRNSVAFSFDLINAAEKLWQSVKHDPEKPKVIPEAENAASFVWRGKYPDKEFHIRLTADDGIMKIEWALFGRDIDKPLSSTTTVIGDIKTPLRGYFRDNVAT